MTKKIEFPFGKSVEIPQENSISSLVKFPATQNNFDYNNTNIKRLTEQSRWYQMPVKAVLVADTHDMFRTLLIKTLAA